MLKTQITKEELAPLGIQVKALFGLPELESGLELQQKGFVYNTEITQDRKLVAKVQDVQVFDVQLDLQALPSSVCTCHHEGTCKHMAAAFLYVYAVYGRPDAFVRSVKQEEEPASPQRNVSALHRKTVMLAGSAEGIDQAPKESAAPDQWLTFVQEQWEAFTSKNRQHKLFLDDFYNAALQTLTQPAQWWSRTPRMLFTILTGLFLLRRVDDDARQREAFGYLVAGDRHKEAASALLDKWKAAVREVDAEEAASRWVPHVVAIAVHARELLLEARAESPYSALAAYRLLWTRLLQFLAADAMEQEMRRLEALYPDEAHPDYTRQSALLALVHFQLLLNRDDAAWDLLAKGRHFRPEQLLDFLEEWKQEQNWPRVWHWLGRLMPAMRTLNEKSFQQFCSYGHEAAKALGHSDEWLGKLAQLLPRSYYAYTEALMALGRYRRWVNFHVAERIGLSSLYPIDMRVIESQDPSLLLPVFHQAIDDQIRQKNRTAYKEAIRLLKKLSALYKQMERQDRFELYLERLARHYGRLRAFQEELKRGKLIR